jgi:hypothetical protein
MWKRRRERSCGRWLLSHLQLGMPLRVLMTANRNSLKEATAKNADLATVIQEQQQ